MRLIFISSLFFCKRSSTRENISGMFSFDEKEGSSFGIFAGLLQDIWSPDWVQT